MKTARIWIDYNDSWVKITITEDKPFQFSHYSRNSEGGHRHSERYTIEDGMVVCEIDDRGNDCDGRYEQTCKSTWPIGGKTRAAWVGQGPYVDGEGYADIYDESIQTPCWERYSSSQRDYAAEAMGY